MQFSAVLLATLFATALAAPADDASVALSRRAQCNPDDATPAVDLKKRDDGDDDEELTIVEASLNERNVFARDTIHCANCGKIKRVKANYKGSCNPSDSKGFMGAHRCKDTQGGKSYLCVQSGVATCYSIQKAFNKKFESGECFK